LFSTKWNGIEQRRPARLIDLFDHVDLDQRVQRAVERRFKQPGDLVLNELVDLVGAEVTPALDEGFKDGAPLNRQGEAALFAQPLKRLHAVTLT